MILGKSNLKELKGSDRLWIRPILKDEKGVKRRERERIEAAKISVKKDILSRRVKKIRP